MWTTYVALLPAFLVAYVASRHSVHEVFLRVYIPVLLLLPGYYRALIPGLPDPTFAEAAAVALFIVFVARGAPGYRFGLTDLLVAAYALSISYSQYRASGFSDAQNLMFFQLSSVLIPYVLAKSLIEPKGLGLAFARQFVICALIVAVLNLYENRFGMNLWQRILSPLFPGFGAGWVTTFRFGLARASGPYGHALLAGIIMFVAYRLQRWLHWANAWPTRRPSWLPLPLPWALTIGMGVGLLSTLAKGAIFASFIAAMVPIVGRSKRRAAVATTILALLVLIGIPALLVFLQWASVGRLHALSVNQETAAYRYELIVQYIDIAHQQLWFGWGLNEWPRVANMPSIDNYYLLLYLMHGAVASTAFVFLILSLIVRLLVKGMQQPLADPPGSALTFTLAAILVGYLLGAVTVFLGVQTLPLLFMIAGWAESHLVRGCEPAVGRMVKAVSPPLYRFRRVVG